MADRVPSLQSFLDSLDGRLHEMSVDEICGSLLLHAQGLPVADRDGFLAIFTTTDLTDQPEDAEKSSDVARGQSIETRCSMRSMSSSPGLRRRVLRRFRLGPRGPRRAVVRRRVVGVGDRRPLLERAARLPCWRSRPRAGGGSWTRPLGRRPWSPRCREDETNERPDRS